MLRGLAEESNIAHWLSYSHAPDPSELAVQLFFCRLGHEADKRRKHRRGQTHLLPKICQGFTKGPAILSLKKSESSSYASQASARVRKIASRLLLRRIPESGEGNHDLLHEFAATREPAGCLQGQEIRAFGHDLTTEKVQSASPAGEKFAGMFMTASVLLQECQKSG